MFIWYRLKPSRNRGPTWCWSYHPVTFTMGPQIRYKTRTNLFCLGNWSIFTEIYLPTHWPNGFLDVLGYQFFWGWARMKPKAVLSLSLPCTSWIMLKYLKYAEIFEIFGKICQKYAERWNIFAQFTLPMTNESTSLISAYWHLYMSVELGLEAYLAHFTKYLQSGNNICESFKYHFQVPWLTQFDLPYQGTLFYRGCMV